MYQTFIGIDIGKHEFYVAIHNHSTVNQYTNTSKGFETFFKEYKHDLTQAFIVLETTGGYERALLRFLQQRDCAVHRANTRQVKFFIRSLGKLGKSDAIDAIALAQYAQERHTKLPLFVENNDETLLKLSRRRTELKQMIVKEKNRAKAPEQDILGDSFAKVMAALDEAVADIDAQIAEYFTQNKLLQQKRDVLKTIPGIGDVVATGLLALLPELGAINRRQIASLAAVAPHPNESGDFVGYRRTRGGRPDVKPMLFIAAMTAARSHSDLGQFYRQLVDAGKKKMVALVALMRKIIVIANARLRDFCADRSHLIT